MLESRQLGGAMHEVRLGPDSLGMRQLTVIDLPITAQRARPGRQWPGAGGFPDPVFLLGQFFADSLG